MRTKHQSIRIRKKFKKTPPYRCCRAPTGNPNKYASGRCCTYPQTYRRRDIMVECTRVCKEAQSEYSSGLGSYFD